jgi:hypothetical protein
MPPLRHLDQQNGSDVLCRLEGRPVRKSTVHDLINDVILAFVLVLLVIWLSARLRVVLAQTPPTQTQDYRFTIQLCYDRPCTPPATFQYVGIRLCGPASRQGFPPECRVTSALTPFNAPVRFDRVVMRGGEPYWQWIKAGEPPAPCSAAEAARTPECGYPIGRVLFQTPAFKLVQK